LAVTLGRVLDKRAIVVLLDGDVGAGKNAFRRALIQSLLDVPEDVFPRPHFTWCRRYDTRDGRDLACVSLIG